MISLLLKKNIIWCFFAFTFERSHGVLEYEFQIENVTSIKTNFLAAKLLRFPNHPFYKLNESERKNLCTAAIKNAPLEEVSLQAPLERLYVFAVEGYSITYENFSAINDIGIMCPSKPRSILRLGDAHMEIKIVFVKAVSPPPKIEIKDLVFMFMLGIGSNYEFETEVVTFVHEIDDGTLHDFPNASWHPILQLTRGQRKTLCTAAKDEVVALESVNPNVEPYSSLDKYLINQSEGKMISAIMLRCKTIPESYLRLGNAPGVINVVHARNEFEGERYSFTVELILNNQVRQVREKIRQKNRILNMMDLERLLLCVAGKKHIERTMPMEFYALVLPILISDVPGKPEMVEFETRLGLIKHVAFACPTDPLLYVYFVGQSVDDIMLIIVQDLTDLIP